MIMMLTNIKLSGGKVISVKVIEYLVCHFRFSFDKSTSKKNVVPFPSLFQVRLYLNNQRIDINLCLWTYGRAIFIQYLMSRNFLNLKPNIICYIFPIFLHDLYISSENNICKR